MSRRVPDVLTLEAITSAYARTGFTPAAGLCFSRARGNACCPGTAVVVARGPDDPAWWVDEAERIEDDAGGEPVATMAARLGVDANELDWFVFGWDASERAPSDYEAGDDGVNLLAYEHGRAMRRAFKPADFERAGRFSS